MIGYADVVRHVAATLTFMAVTLVAVSQLA
jgi:hypothetical protein